MKYSQAKRLRALIEQFAATLTDEEALDGGETLFPRWSGNSVSYAVGDRVYYEGVLYKVIQAHTSLSTWTPDMAVSLFAKVLIPSDDPEDIPDWEQPGSTNPYMMGDKVRYEGHVYESVIDNNIWSPAGYPAGWRMIE